MGDEIEDRYRYWLMREWGGGNGKHIAWVMLNPSTANATEDDPTIRRCISFSKREGYSNMIVVNLCAYRATKPADLFSADGDIAGASNDIAILRAVRMSSKIVVAWGANAARLRERTAHVLQNLLPNDVVCLGRTSQGYPRHPLRVRGDQPLERYRL